MASHLHFIGVVPIRSGLTRLGSPSVLICEDTKTCSSNTHEKKTINNDKIQRGDRNVKASMLLIENEVNADKLMQSVTVFINQP